MEMGLTYLSIRKVEILEIVKTKKISSGYYEGEYKGVKFAIQKIETINNTTRNKWVWLIGGKGGEDWFGKKATAILAVKEMIDELNK